jgi:hypothetical protein
MSPGPEQVDLPIKVKKELTQEEMREIYLKSRGKGAETLKKIREEHKRMKKEWEEGMAKLVKEKWEENHQEGDGSDYEEYEEMEKVKVLWRSKSYDVIGSRRSIENDMDFVYVDFRNDGNWYIDNKKVDHEEEALSYIRRDHTKEQIQEIINLRKK